MQRTNSDQLILVDPVEEDVEEIRPRTDPPNVWQCDLKKQKEYYSLILIESIITLFILAGNRLNYSNIFNVITDYPPFVN